MNTPNLVLLYVKDPTESAKFYERIFGVAPTTAFPTYAAFELAHGLNIGLWSTSAKNFVSGGEGHRSELAFMVVDEPRVRELEAQLACARGHDRTAATHGRVRPHIRRHRPRRPPPARVHTGALRIKGRRHDLVGCMSLMVDAVGLETKERKTLLEPR